MGKKRTKPSNRELCSKKAAFPHHLIKGLAEIGAFGPQLPVEYGCGGLDYTAYGLIMQEIERGDSGIRSTASVQGSLVMYPIFKFGTEETKTQISSKISQWVK